MKALKQIEKPIKGYAPVTLAFGEMYQGVRHAGIDFGVPEGTPVLACSAGTVLQSGFQQGGYGWYVLLIHPDGSGSVYAHLCRQGLPTGSSVVAGAIIGYSGNTGNSSGPHLHFEYRERASYGSSVVDPAPYFVSNQSIPVPSAQLKDELAIGAAEVVCDVANVRTQDMRVIGQIRKGTPVTLTGDKQMYNGLPFYKALAVREVWIAAHDSDTQIIDNVK